MVVLNWLKKYWIPTALVVAGLLIWAYFYFRNPKNRISFGFESDNDVAQLLPFVQGRLANIPENQRGVGVYLDVPLTAIVKNKSAKDVTLNNIAGSLSYEGQAILQTKGDSKALQAVSVAGKGRQPVTDTFQVLVNGKTIKFIKDYLAGKKPKLNYNMSAMILGDVYNFKDSAVLNETSPASGEASGETGGEAGGATGGRG